MKSGKGGQQDAKSPPKTGPTADIGKSATAEATATASSSNQAEEKVTAVAEEGKQAEPAATSAQSCTLQVWLLALLKCQE